MIKNKKLKIREINRYVDIRSTVLQEQAMDWIKSKANKVKGNFKSAVNTAKSGISNVKKNTHNNLAKDIGNYAKNADWKSLGAAAMRNTLPGYALGNVMDIKQTYDDVKGGQDWKQAGMDLSNKGLDRSQGMLTTAGLYNPVADLANAGVSGVRGAMSQAMGDQPTANKHYVDAAINATSAIPIAGDAVGLTKNAVKIGKYGLKGGKTAYKADKNFGSKT